MKQAAAHSVERAEEALAVLVSELVLLTAETSDVNVKPNTVTSGNLPVDREHGVCFDYELDLETGRGSATLSLTARRAKLTAHWRGGDGTIGSMEERLLLDLASSPDGGRLGYGGMESLAEALLSRLRKRLEELRNG